MSSRAANIIPPSINTLANSMLCNSCQDISCHMDRPHRDPIAIAIPEITAAVFLRTLRNEKIKIPACYLYLDD